MPAQPELQRVCENGGGGGRTPERYDKHAGDRKGPDALAQGTSEQQILDPAGDARRSGQSRQPPSWIQVQKLWKGKRGQITEDESQQDPNNSKSKRCAGVT